MWLRVTRPPHARVASFSALTLGFFDVAPEQLLDVALVHCFSALTLGFFDVARRT